jgi:Putative cyclase
LIFSSRCSAWSEKGIVGRGILVDYHSWREANGIPYDAFKSQSIPLAHLKATLEAQGTSVKFGDILIIRSGYMHAYNQKSRLDLEELSKLTPPGFAGVEQSEQMLQWIWENFAAVAGDHPSFERWRK